MNCTEFQNIIDSGQISKEQQLLIDEHMNQCSDCRNYFMVVHYAIENAADLLEADAPSAEFAIEIGQFVFEKQQAGKVVPMWVKITSAAAAIVFGLIIGSTVYDSRTTVSNSQEYSYINTTTDTVYMAETTEIMYRSFLSENEGE